MQKQIVKFFFLLVVFTSCINNKENNFFYYDYDYKMFKAKYDFKQGVNIKKLKIYEFDNTGIPSDFKVIKVFQLQLNAIRDFTSKTPKYFQMDSKTIFPLLKEMDFNETYNSQYWMEMETQKRYDNLFLEPSSYYLIDGIYTENSLMNFLLKIDSNGNIDTLVTRDIILSPV